VSKETYYSVKRDLLQCQKRPKASEDAVKALSSLSKGTYYGVKRDLLVSKETYYSVKRDLIQFPCAKDAVQALIAFQNAHPDRKINPKFG
jgi:hypothetical protein